MRGTSGAGLSRVADESRIHRRIAVFLAAMCLGFCAGIDYELYVWLANHALGADIGTSWDRLTGD
jgi:hypothetical protein